MSSSVRSELTYLHAVLRTIREFLTDLLGRAVSGEREDANTKAKHDHSEHKLGNSIQ